MVAEAWLLMKEKDAHTRRASEFNVVDAQPDSALEVPVPARPATPFPDRLSPQLASLVDKPPVGSGWLYEIKFDGYRLLT